MSVERKFLELMSEKFAQELLEQLKPVEVRDGETIKIVRTPSATLNVIRQFLKDNGIEARATKGSPLGNLVEALPSFDNEQDAEDYDNIQH
jgi:hypothetical protein